MLTHLVLCPQESAALTRQLANAKLASGSAVEAAAAFEQLVKLDATDIQALAALVVATSEFDIIKSEQYARRLPALPVGLNVAEMDVKALEALLAPPKKKHIIEGASGRRGYVPDPSWRTDI